MIKRALLSFALILWAFSDVFAYDFSAPNSGGTMIYYNLNPALKAATVTYKTLAEATPDYTGKVVIPGEVRYEGTVYRVVSIGDSAFYRCAGMSGVEIPSSVDSIQKKAFSYSGLTEVAILGTVGWLMPDAFYYCGELKKVVLEDSPDLMRWYSEENSATYFFEGTQLENLYLGRDLIYTSFISNLPTLKELTFGHFVTRVPIFEHCTGLTEIVIPNSVVSIGWYAFSGCTGLTKVVIPNSVISIEGAAFSDCINLTEVVLPDSLTSISYEIFYGCRSLTRITIPESVTSIGLRAFKDCTGLTKVVIPNSVISIEGTAFSDCINLTEVVLPDSLTAISYEIFYGCRSLTRITIPESVTSIGAAAFDRCSSLTEIVIPESVTSIGSYAFSETGITEIVIPKSVTKIEEGTFRRSSLREISIPNTVESIGPDAFARSATFTRFVIEDGETTLHFPGPSPIGEGTFYSTVIFYFYVGRNVSFSGRSPFYNLPLMDLVIGKLVTSIPDSTYLTPYRTHLLSPVPPKVLACSIEPIRAYLYVPPGSKETYESDPLWKSFFREIRDSYPLDLPTTDCGEPLSVIRTAEGFTLTGCKETDPVSVFSVDGQLLYRSTVGDGIIAYPFERGIVYLIRTSGKTLKVRF